MADNIYIQGIPALDYGRVKLYLQPTELSEMCIKMKSGNYFFMKTVRYF